MAGTELASTNMSGKSPEVGTVGATVGLAGGAGVGLELGAGVGGDTAAVGVGVGSNTVVVGLGLGAGVGTVLAGAGEGPPFTIVKVYATAQRRLPSRFFWSNSSATIV